MTTAVIPVLVVVVLLAIDLWVYADAKRCAGAGAPVRLRVGTFVVETPLAWFVACLVLWVVFFPVYVVSRTE